MNKKFSCYLCGNEAAETLAEAGQMRFACFGYDKIIVRCCHCGLVQMHPMWTETELNELYSKYWQKQDFPGQKRKVKLSAYLDRYIKKGDRVLEIGCGWGDNLKRLRAKGHNVIGLDKDPAVCDGKTIINADINDFRSAEKFDLIYGIHLFEHLADPHRFIAWVKDNLKPGGSFLLEIPSLDDPLIKLFKIKEFSRFYWYPYHLFFYDRETAAKMFERFPDLEISVRPLQEYGLINHLRWLIFRRPGNLNFSLPLLDDLYRSVLTGLFKASDRLIVHGRIKPDQESVK